MFFGKLKNSGDWGFFPLKDRFEKCIEIDNKTHMNLINEANSKGKLISGDKKGNPILVDPPKPTEEDQIVINYARLCGYNWIAKDLGNNGHCFAYKEKPVKTNYGWDNQPIAKQPAMFLHYCVSCVSEDEPYCIKKENKED